MYIFSLFFLWFLTFHTAFAKETIVSRGSVNTFLSNPDKFYAPLRELEYGANIKQKPIDLNELLTAAKKEWLMPNDVERWEMHPNPYQHEAHKFYPFFEKMGLFKVYEPSQKEYDYAIICGGFSSRMELRVRFFKKHFQKFDSKDKNQKVHINKKKYFLVSERPLDPEAEKWIIMQAKRSGKNITTEADAAKYLWEKELPNTDIEFVVGKLQSKNHGRLRRPAFAMVLDSWMNEKKPLPGSILMVSNNPYILYQHLTLVNFLKKHGWDDTKLETVGDVEDGVSLMSIYLDTVTRILDLLIEFEKIKTKR